MPPTTGTATRAAHTLWVISRRALACLAQRSQLPPLVALVRDGTAAQKVSAADALKVLARSADNRIPIAKAGGIPPLVALVRDGDAAQKENAAGALRNLANDCA